MYSKIKVMLNAFSDTFKDNFANFYTMKLKSLKQNANLKVKVKTC